MAKPLADWVADDLEDSRGRPVEWLSQYFFFRDPTRSTYSDLGCFLSPADGVIVYQREVEPGEPLVEIKGRELTLRDAMRDPTYDRPSLVVGIFMTFYDVHINRMPYPGRLSYRTLDPVDSYNHPMLGVETSLVEKLRIDLNAAEYLHHNQRVLNRVESPQLGGTYHLLQIADYDVDCITPFELRQNRYRAQGQRFSQIRYGSQVDLIVPLSDLYRLTPLLETGTHVEAGLDPIVSVTRTRTAPTEEKDHR